MSAHKSPEQIRSQLKHPVVDGDGHWLEYAPVFSEKMRKAGGDLAADGFLAALRKFRKDDQWGFVYTWQRTNIYAAIRQNGGDIFNADRTKATLNSPRELPIGRRKLPGIRARS